MIWRRSSEAEQREIGLSRSEAKRMTKTNVAWMLPVAVKLLQMGETCINIYRDYFCKGTLTYLGLMLGRGLNMSIS